MKKIKSVTLIAVLFLATAACNKNDEENKIPSEITMTEKSADIIAADNQFGFELFQKVNASLDEPKNTMISPMSVSLALAMVYNGTDGDTKKQMEDMLHKSGMTPDEINENYKELVAALSSHDPKVELAISNAIFYKNTFPVKNEFITTNQNYYNADVAGLDFSQTTETMNKVNGWVNTNTKGKIEKILDQVSPDDIMYLLNAIYFNGEWQYRFNSKETTNMPFTKEDNQVVQAPTMTIENKFNYFSNQTFQMLEIPYGSGKYSMLVFLPASGKTTNDVISLLNPGNMTDWLSKMTEQNRKLYLPKFEFKFDQSLVDVLKALGMTDAFSSNANFSGIADGGNLEISEVMHKTYIKVDERGTEAAAVTAVIFTNTAAHNDSFRIDHPFVFAIREKDTNAILFVGKVMNPTQK